MAHKIYSKSAGIIETEIEIIYLVIKLIQRTSHFTKNAQDMTEIIPIILKRSTQNTVDKEMLTKQNDLIIYKQ